MGRGRVWWGGEVKFPTMSATDAGIPAEPIDNGRCKFLVSEPLHVGGVRRFAPAGEARGSPPAQTIFALPRAGGSEGILSGHPLTGGERSPPPPPLAGETGGPSPPPPPPGGPPP